VTSYVGHDADHSGDCCHRHQDEGLRRQERQHHQRLHLHLRAVDHLHQQNQDGQGHLLRRDEHQDHQDEHQDHQDEHQEHQDERQEHQDEHQDLQVAGQAQDDLLEERDVKNQEVAE
jgi:hypothetical protein